MRFSGGNLPIDMSLALKYISGNGVAYISSYGLISFSLIDIIEFYSYWKSGKELGEIVRIMNNKVTECYGIMPSLILLGDPLLSLNYENNQNECILEDNLILDNDLNYYKDIEKVRESYLEDYEKYDVGEFLRESDQEYNEFYCTQLRYFSTKNYENLIKMVDASCHVNIYDANIQEIISKYYKMIELIQYMIVKECIDRAESGEWFYENYWSFYKLDKNKTKTTVCENCGNLANEIEYHNKYFIEHRRKSIWCPKCSIVSDKQDERVKVIFSNVLDSIYLDQTSKVTIKLKMSNLGKGLAKGVLGIGIYSGKNSIDNQFIKFKLCEKEEKEISFDINISNIAKT